MAKILSIVFSRSEMALRCLCTQISPPPPSEAVHWHFAPPSNCLHSNSISPPFPPFHASSTVNTIWYGFCEYEQAMCKEKMMLYATHAHRFHTRWFLQYYSCPSLIALCRFGLFRQTFDMCVLILQGNASLKWTLKCNNFVYGKHFISLKPRLKLFISQKRGQKFNRLW